MGYILFSADKEFSIQVSHPHWNYIIEYSYDNNKWNEWNGEQIINNTIYMRGVNNTLINCATSGLIMDLGGHWIINGKNVKCQGNIENLLDYKSVINNIHPKMGNFCFYQMFYGCSALIEAPQFLSNTLSDDCYCNMFFNCASLTISPLFPTFTIAKEAIIKQHMLDFCHIKFININNKLYDINVFKLL